MRTSNLYSKFKSYSRGRKYLKSN